jgi:hypothetical protein
VSTIHVRNVAGVGPFTLPTSGAMLDASGARWRSILDGISGLEYSGAYTLVINRPDIIGEEQVLVAESWVYQYDVAKPEGVVAQLRAAIISALNADSNIASFGNVEIQMWRQGDFYEQAPRIARVDRLTGTVYFENRIPPGAQIEVYKFTRHPPHPDHGGTRPEPPRIGNRFRPDRMLPVGATSWQVPTALYISAPGKRQQFKFAYRWPEPPNTPAPAPGIRGPLCPLSICTATISERSYGSTIFLFPAPRSPKGNEK